MEYFLKFSDEAEFISVMSAGQGGSEIVFASHDHALIAVGKISKPTGATLIDPDGVGYPEMQLIEGWHCNIEYAGDLPAYLAPYLVTPHNPVCVIGK